MGESFKIRVASQSEPKKYRTITVSSDGNSVFCDCDGFDAANTICSHIDAILLAGEREMVFPDDRLVADDAMKVVAGKIHPPSSWKGSWRKNWRWRGLSVRTRRTIDPSGKPVVCFTGKMDRQRKELISEAKENGWEAVDSPHKHITLLVAQDPHGKSDKLTHARKDAIPIISLDDWPEAMLHGLLPDEA